MRSLDCCGGEKGVKNAKKGEERDNIYKLTKKPRSISITDTKKAQYDFFTIVFSYNLFKKFPQV